MGLKKAVGTHNKISVCADQLNSMFNYLIFILFYFAKIPLNGLLYISNDSNTNIYARIIMVVLLLVCVTVLFTVNLMSVSVSKWAHTSYKLMFGLLCITRMPLECRTKIERFIERLSGPGIGFYCLNMFVINNYVFFGYVMSWLSNYFLIVELVDKINI